MTEWTSISVTEEQKETLIEAKPEGKSMGTFLVDAIDSNSNANSNAIDEPVAVEMPDVEDRLTEMLDSDKGDIQDVLNRLDDLETSLKAEIEGLKR